jgi:hypothetical protein
VATVIIESIVLALGISSMVAYETTGKGLADHTISAVRNQDCKIARSIQGKDICQPEHKGTVTVSEPTRPHAVSTVKTMEDVFAQRQALVDQKIQK